LSPFIVVGYGTSDLFEPTVAVTFLVGAIKSKEYKEIKIYFSYRLQLL
jgi:hypothetical protein